MTAEKNRKHLTQKDIEEGREFAEKFAELNQAGKILVKVFMSGLEGNSVVKGVTKEKQEEKKPA